MLSLPWRRQEEEEGWSGVIVIDWIERNDDVLFSAQRNGEQVFIQVRRSDGKVLCNNTGQPTFYSESFKNLYPRCAAQTLVWVGLNSQDPKQELEVDWETSPPTWYFRGEVFDGGVHS